MTCHTDRKHLAIFVPSLSGGGAERVMVAVANGLSSRGYRVDLVLGRLEGPYLSEVNDSVRVVCFNKNRVLACLAPLVGYLRKERPDAILSALNHANIIAILAHIFARSGSRLIVSERNSLTGLPRNLRDKVIRKLMRYLYPKADGIVAVSSAIADELAIDLGQSRERIFAIPNPVDIGKLETFSRVRPNHPWFGRNQPPVLLAVGRLEMQKDFQSLLKAFAVVVSKRPVRLIILGEGALRTDLQRSISALGLTGFVDLAGFKDNPFGWMAACDLFVLSSRYEGFPNVLVQAMACGARVVSTDCETGPREILEGGRWGRLVPVGRPDLLAEQIEGALEDSAPPEARIRVKKYRSEKVFDEYESVLFPEVG